MALVKVRQNYQITIPAEVRKSMKIGDYLDVEKKDGDLVLKMVVSFRQACVAEKS